MNTILELKHITAGYDDLAVLKDVNFQINEQDFIGIIGPNGGGKTTLLKVILGLLQPETGEVVYHRPKQNLFGYLPQNSR
ncbi:MAG: ATP-binding cassette domain-containing protein, partial [Odoribacter sp.]|nr:ATP-binding cassette domain-containing protein [Odoribacter sp.]